MQISVADDRRTREALLTASSTRGGRRMDSMLLPLELLCAVPTSQFLDRKFHSRWRKRQVLPAFMSDTSSCIEAQRRQFTEFMSFASNEFVSLGRLTN